MTKVDVKCYSCQRTKNTRSICVIIKVIVSSGERCLLVCPVMHERSLEEKQMGYAVHACRNNTIIIFVEAGRLRKNLGSHIDVFLSRQPLLEGERLVRYDVKAVMQLIRFRAQCTHTSCLTGCCKSFD